MANINLTTVVMSFDYPVDCDNQGYAERMEKLSELLSAGWEVQGSPYVIQSFHTHFEKASLAQVLLVKKY